VTCWGGEMHLVQVKRKDRRLASSRGDMWPPVYTTKKQTAFGFHKGGPWVVALRG